jgi:DNA excision repair protein ERCC-4
VLRRVTTLVRLTFLLCSQLEAEWHRTPQRTKQLVTDVGVLRKLLDYLIRYDAFAFYYLLMKLQQASNEQATPSLW